jgi:hypothetical protein
LLASISHVFFFNMAQRTLVVGMPLLPQAVAAKMALIPQSCHSHVNTAVDFMNGKDIDIDVDNVLNLHKIAEVLENDGLREATLVSMRQQVLPSDVAAADFFEKALNLSLPNKTMRMVMQFLPTHVVISRLNEDTGLEPGKAQTGPAPATATYVSEMADDFKAKEIFEKALNGGLPTEGMRSLIQSLPLHVVQHELTQRSRANLQPYEGCCFYGQYMSKL